MAQEGTFSTPGTVQVTDLSRGDVFARNCPTRQLLDRVGDKWSVLILMLLGGGGLRFNELKRRIDGISQKMLSQTLRSLERDGLVEREVHPGKPISVSYTLLPLGAGLLGAVRMMTDWAETNMAEVAQAQARYDAGEAEAA